MKLWKKKIKSSYNPPFRREYVDFKEKIGIYVNKLNQNRLSTTWGVIHYGKEGCHIIPARPLDEKADIDSEIKSSFKVALRGLNLKNLRALIYSLNKEKLNLQFLFYQEPLEEEIEDLYVVGSEIYADFPNEVKKINEEFIIWNGKEIIGENVLNR